MGNSLRTSTIPNGEYLTDITERLGADRGDALQPWTWTEKTQWGELAGVHRVHSHLSRVLALLLKGRESKGEAYIVQLLQSLRQVSLDGGVWSSASLLLPRPDPLYTKTFGATEVGLEVVVTYQETMKKIRSNYAPKEDSEKAEDSKGARCASKEKD